MIPTDTDTAQTSIAIPIPIPGIFTHDIPSIGIGTISILDLIQIPIQIPGW